MKKLSYTSRFVGKLYTESQSLNLKLVGFAIRFGFKQCKGSVAIFGF